MEELQRWLHMQTRLHFSMTEECKGQRQAIGALDKTTICSLCCLDLTCGFSHEDGKGMPGHAVVPVARSPGGSQFCEQSPTEAHAPRALPQPCPLLPGHFPNSTRCSACCPAAPEAVRQQLSGCSWHSGQAAAQSLQTLGSDQRARFEKWSPWKILESSASEFWGSLRGCRIQP